MIRRTLAIGTLSLLAIASVLGLAQSDNGATLIEDGILEIQIEGETRGFETFGLQRLPDGRHELFSQQTLVAGDQTINRSQSLTLDARFRPRDYSLIFDRPNGRQSVSATIQDGEAEMVVEAPDGETQRQTITSDREILMLDNGMISQVVAMGKRRAELGQDTIEATFLAPQRLSAVPFRIERVGSITLRTGDNRVPATEVCVTGQVSDGSTLIIRHFFSAGRFIASLQPGRENTPETLAFRRDHFPEGLTVPEADGESRPDRCT